MRLSCSKKQRFPSRSSSSALAAVMLALLNAPAPAAVLTASPLRPQPGDVLTLTVTPSPGESLQGVRMSAFDTPVVRFYPRPDGSQRAFLGFPFDRSGGPIRVAGTAVLLQEGRTLQQPVEWRGRAVSRAFPTQRITMKPSTASRMTHREAFRREKAIVQRAMRDSNPGPLWTDPWIVPAAGRSTSSYGRRRFVNGRPWGQHNGADIEAGTGTPVRATNSGRAVLSQYLPTLRGNCVVIDHGCNVFSVYMHLSQRLVSVGTAVDRGQVIGKVGATGFVTGPHLHWEIRIGWEPVDPFRVVSRGLYF